MSKLLVGSFNSVGKEPVVRSESVVTAIEAGLAVKKDASGNLVKVSAATDVTVGFAMPTLGKAEAAAGKQSVGYSGFQYLAQVGSAAPDIGAGCYIDANGKVSSDNTGAAVNAICASAPVDAYLLGSDGVPLDTAIQCVYIDFPGGL